MDFTESFNTEHKTEQMQNIKKSVPMLNISSA